jgi:preprotein translocase subunit YajC
MGTLILPLLLLGAMYFLIIRPQQKRVREQSDLVKSLEVGDEILTSAGLYGTITLVDGEVMLVEVADGIEVRMATQAVTQLVTYEDDDEDEDQEDGVDEDVQASDD